jgi:transcriptional regulator with XRE-family HTH domain
LSELGDVLRSARERRNLALADVARDTRIKESYLEALEAGDYASLPGPAYITGFLRNYARHIGLHPDDVVQEYHSDRPANGPTIRAATRVLANGHRRAFRTRLLWTLATVVLLLAGGFAIKQYNDAYGKTTTPLNLTPANLGAPDPTVHHAAAPPAPRAFSVRLRALAPVWVRVTVDSHRAYEGILRAHAYTPRWRASHAVYVVTYNGADLKMFYNGTHLGLVARVPGLMVDLVTVKGVVRVL